MILFDWEKILRVSKGSVGDTISILRIITYKLPPKNYKDKSFKFYQHNYGGKSFLLNPENLLTTGRSFSDKEVAEYVGVASFRSYPMYLQTKDSTLDLLYLPISEDIIKANRLLEIKDGKVHFRYE
tara:strand:+ start:967 stop:1344 length:378 start_codon:yes stop_codon:yes gene_type:complete